MCRGNQLLGIGADAAFEPSAEGILRGGKDAAVRRQRSLPLFEATFPFRRCLAFHDCFLVSDWKRVRLVATCPSLTINVGQKKRLVAKRLRPSLQAGSAISQGQSTTPRIPAWSLKRAFSALPFRSEARDAPRRRSLEGRYAHK